MALKQLVDFSVVCSWAVLIDGFFFPSMYVDFFLPDFFHRGFSLRRCGHIIL